MQRSRFFMNSFAPLRNAPFWRKSFDIVAEDSECVKRFFEKFEVFLKMVRFFAFLRSLPRFFCSRRSKKIVLEKSLQLFHFLLESFSAKSMTSEQSNSFSR